MGSLTVHISAECQMAIHQGDGLLLPVASARRSRVIAVYALTSLRQYALLHSFLDWVVGFRSA